jgi:hypothetical protein
LNSPSSISAVVGISAVENMTAAYNGSNSGQNFASIIDAVYPTYYVSLQNSNTGNALSNTTWWQQVTTPGGLLQTPYAGYANEGAYSSGTTYAINQVVYSNATAISQLADHDPTLRPSAFVNLPMEFWHGTSDTTIPLAQLQAFQTAMSNLGVNFTINQVSGGHLANAALWNGPAISSFFGPATVAATTTTQLFNSGPVTSSPQFTSAPNTPVTLLTAAQTEYGVWRAANLTNAVPGNISFNGGSSWVSVTQSSQFFQNLIVSNESVLFESTGANATDVVVEIF